MPDRETHRRREAGRREADSSTLGRGSSPVLALQRSIGNRAVAQVLARTPVRTGSVQIGAVGEIKVKGGNLDDWAGTEAPETVELTSQTGKHSRKLEQMSDAGTRTDVKVTIAPANQAGEQLNVGGGTFLEIKHARIKGYAIANGVETWRLADFDDVRRHKVTHTIS
jgi:hypothetical protein